MTQVLKIIFGSKSSYRKRMIKYLIYLLFIFIILSPSPFYSSLFFLSNVPIKT